MGALRQRREPGREEGPGGLPCGTRGASAPWPGVAGPGRGPEPGRARQARDAALVARGGSGLCCRTGQEKGRRCRQDRPRPGGGAEGGLRKGAGIGSLRGLKRG